MQEKARGWSGFRHGLMAGLLSALLGICVAIYVLNVLGIVIVSVTRVPGIQDFFYWTYENLGLSIIPFAGVLVLYVHQLRKLNRLLSWPQPAVERVVQTEKWVDTTTSVFFGIGVLWTAIGMRSALLFALGDLDQSAAAELGSFEILRRLVSGGFLVALSTTIVGGAGGYLMRFVKILVVGSKLETLRNRLAGETIERFERRLRAIEGSLGQLVANVAVDPRLDGLDDERRGVAPEKALAGESSAPGLAAGGGRRS